jgi:hypothetical protein
MCDWPNILTGIGTILMAGAVTFTAIFAFRNWNRSLEKDRQREIRRFFGKFEKLEGPLYFRIFANKTIPDDKGVGKLFMLFGLDKRRNIPYALIKFLSDLGNSLKMKEISLNEVHLYFKNYLYDKDKILFFIRNFTFIFPKLPVDFIDNFNFLMNVIGKQIKYREYTDIVKKSFTQTSYEDFLEQIDKLGLEI